VSDPYGKCQTLVEKVLDFVEKVTNLTEKVTELKKKVIELSEKVIGFPRQQYLVKIAVLRGNYELFTSP
jgi:hypothetical protein